MSETQSEQAPAVAEVMNRVLSEQARLIIQQWLKDCAEFTFFVHSETKVEGFT